MATAESKKKGVVLKVEETAIPKDNFTIIDKEYGERHFVRHGSHYEEVTKTPIKPVRTHADRQYSIRDTESFIAYVNRYGKDKDGIIFYNDKGLKMLFEESNRKEFVSLPFGSSLELRSFLGEYGTSKEFTQKQFFKVLETFSDCLGEQAKILLPSVERLRLDSQIEFESNIDPHDMIFTYKDKAGLQTTHIPKKLVLTLPYFEGSNILIDLAVDLEVSKPRNENDKPYFTLTDPKAERTERDALDEEINVIKDGLPEWMFVHGKEQGH